MNAFVLTVAACLLLLSSTVLAVPADDLAQAKAELAASHTYSADALLQKIVKSPDASRAQVEEALFLQTMIYYGDVFGASLLMAPVAMVSHNADPYGAEVSSQLVAATAAFSVAANAYLNITAGGSGMKSARLELPELTEADVKKIEATLASKPTVQALVDRYPTDPAEGKGLLARANQFGLYIGFASLTPRTNERDFAKVRSGLSSGVKFDHLRHLNWLASVSIDISKGVAHPSIDLLSIARRADERLLQLAGNQTDSQFVKNARARLAKYGGK